MTLVKHSLNPQLPQSLMAPKLEKVITFYFISIHIPCNMADFAYQPQADNSKYDNCGRMYDTSYTSEKWQV